MSTKLTQELEKAQTKQYQELESEGILKKVDQLLIGHEETQTKVLKDAGFRTPNQYESKLVEDYKRTEIANKIYSTKSYTGKQIKDICIKYDLRMLPTRYYQGAIDVDLADKIEDFLEKNNLAMNEGEFFILAPVESFETVEKIVPRNVDPILFYRTDKNRNRYSTSAGEDETFTQIHNWGNDFTELRRWRFLLDQSKSKDDWSTNSMKTIFLILSVILTFIACIIGNGGFIAFSLLICAVTLFNFLFIDTNTLNDDKWNTNEVISS